VCGAPSIVFTVRFFKRIGKKGAQARIDNSTKQQRQEWARNAAIARSNMSSRAGGRKRRQYHRRAIKRHYAANSAGTAVTQHDLRVPISRAL